MDLLGDLLEPEPVPAGKAAGLLGTVGQHLREARLRRNLTIEQVAKAVGVTRKTIAEAEKGNPATGAGVFAGIFCALGLAYQLELLATPERENDDELMFDVSRKRARPPRS